MSKEDLLPKLSLARDATRQPTEGAAAVTGTFRFPSISRDRAAASAVSPDPTTEQAGALAGAPGRRIRLKSVAQKLARDKRRFGDAPLPPAKPEPILMPSNVLSVDEVIDQLELADKERAMILGFVRDMRKNPTAAFDSASSAARAGIVSVNKGSIDEMTPRSGQAARRAEALLRLDMATMKRLADRENATSVVKEQTGSSAGPERDQVFVGNHKEQLRKEPAQSAAAESLQSCAAEPQASHPEHSKVLRKAADGAGLHGPESPAAPQASHPATHPERSKCSKAAAGAGGPDGGGVTGGGRLQRKASLRRHASRGAAAKAWHADASGSAAATVGATVGATSAAEVSEADADTADTADTAATAAASGGHDANKDAAGRGKRARWVVGKVERRAVSGAAGVDACRLCVYLSIYPSIYLSVCLSGWLAGCLSVSLSLSLSLCVCFYLPTYLPTYLSIYLSVYVYIHTQIYIHICIYMYT